MSGKRLKVDPRHTADLPAHGNDTGGGGVDAVRNKELRIILTHLIPIHQMHVIEVTCHSVNDLVVGARPSPIGIDIKHSDVFDIGQGFKQLNKLGLHDISIGTKMDHHIFNVRVFLAQLLNDLQALMRLTTGHSIQSCFWKMLNDVIACAKHH